MCTFEITCRGGRHTLRNMVVLKKGWILSWKRYWQRGRYFSKGEKERKRESERERDLCHKSWIISPVLGVWDFVPTAARVKRNWKHFYQIWRFVEPLNSRWTRSHTEWFPWLRARTTSIASSLSNERDRYKILSPSYTTLHGIMEVLTLV